MEAELKETEKGLNNLVKVIEQGVFSETVQKRLMELENRKSALLETIEAEKIKQAISEDEHSIQKYFDMYASADFDDEEVRNTILEYFVDKIYVYNDQIVITWWYSDDKTEIGLDDLTAVTDGSSEGSTLKQSAPPPIP